MKIKSNLLWLLVPLVCCCLTLTLMMHRQEVTTLADEYASQVVKVLSNAQAPTTNTLVLSLEEEGTQHTTNPSSKLPASQAAEAAASAAALKAAAAATAVASPQPADSTSPSSTPSSSALSMGSYRETHRLLPMEVPGLEALTVQGNNPSLQCPLTKGNWCGPYWTQPLLLAKPPPRGNTPCKNGCSMKGWCDYDTGRCFCTAGYKGVDCTEPAKRPCAGMGPDGKDKNYTHGHWIHTRCGGICDDDIGMCHCPQGTKYGRKVPFGTPTMDPFARGKPMFWCQPNSTADGTPVKWTWNQHTYQDVYGPNGWCNNEHPDLMRKCSCALDGMVGQWCNVPVEQTCMNQCSGHGQCNLGFCMCYEGWYSHDCSRRRAGLPDEPGDHLGAKPWIKAVVRDPPSAQDPPKRPARKRPFIYVYDLDPAYNSHMMQYRLDRNIGVNRLFHERNNSEFLHYNAYALETVFHELMLTSEHRTFDPEEADYYYVPIHVSNLADVVGKADRPFWPTERDGIGQWGHRPFSMSMMVKDAKDWIQANHPYWNRNGGKDHIWLFSHDEAPCYMPNEIWDSVILSHWGRMDFPHGSNSSYGADNYSRQEKPKKFPGGWLEATSKAHPCHDPSKHLVVPVFKQPTHYSHSPYLGGGREVVRDILFFFRGDMGLTREGCIYSRCIRQTLWKLYKANDWRAKYNVLYGDHGEAHGDYTQLLSRSKFCLVIPGDGWSARYEDSTLNGCVPVIIMDNTLGPFESLIDYSKFAIRVGEHQLKDIVTILQAVSPEKHKELQEGLNKAWMRFRWNGLPLHDRDVPKILNENRNMHGGTLPARPGMEWAMTSDNDAFSTVIQWLYSRMPHTKRGP